VQAFREVPAMSHQQFKQVADALFVIATQLSSVAYQNVQQARLITERKQAEEELRRFKTISDNAVYGQVIADLQGNLRYINRFFANIHGYEPEDLIGKHFSLFHNEKQIDAANALIATMLREGHFAPTTVWHCHRDGTEFPMLMSGIVVHDDSGNPQYIAASVVDVTLQLSAPSGPKRVNWNLMRLENRSFCGVSSMTSRRANKPRRRSRSKSPKKRRFCGKSITV
jgi:PAS domain S-box-containing protein